MKEPLNQSIHARLAQKLSESLSAPFPTYTPRRIHGRVGMPGKATAVIGMRRAGKTTFLHQLRHERLVRGTPHERLPYINFEDERLAGLHAKELGALLEEYYRRFPALRGRDSITWCFDEIQLVPGWERFVRRLLDTEKVELFLSGSSAALLSREIASSMRGRAWEVVIHPFGFDEYLRHHELELPANQDFLSAPQRSRIEGAFMDYLEVGGFPEVQGYDVATRHQVLRDYVDVAMMRDVIERHAVSNVIGLRWLVRHLLGNAAGMFSAQKFYAALKSQGLAISKDTVHQLLGHLEDCFLIRTIWVDTASERRRMVNLRKAYPVDPGLIPVFDRTGRPNVGHALETVVFLELERRGLDIAYVRTPEDREVDFVVRGAGGVEELIQVSADATDRDTSERELSALDEAAGLYPEATRRLLTLSLDTMPARIPPGVIAQPAYEWLLNFPAHKRF